MKARVWLLQTACVATIVGTVGMLAADPGIPWWIPSVGAFLLVGIIAAAFWYDECFFRSRDE